MPKDESMDVRTPEAKQAARLNGNRKGGRPKKRVPESDPTLVSIADAVRAGFDAFYQEHPEWAKYRLKT
jgi:hypothetical protein